MSDGLQITREFDEPYSQSTAALPSTFSPSVVGIAGVPYLLDTASGDYKRQAFDVVQQRNTTDNRDVLLLPQDVWRQQAQSWHLGAGQSNLDRDDALPYRYQSSFGIDPWTRYQLSLLPETEQQGGVTYTGEVWLYTNGTYLCAINGSSVYWYSNLSPSASTVGTTTFSGGNIRDIADDGHVVTVLGGDRYIWTVDSPSASAVKWANHQYTTDVNFIAWEKDYLLAGDGNVLYNAVKANNPTTIYTHPDADFRWFSAASGNSCIYVLGRLGDRTTIHRVNIKQDGSGLQPCIVAATLPDGEIGYSIDFYLGFALIGTSKGVRVAVPANDAGDLTLGPIIPTSQPVRCFEGQDRFVWFGDSAINGAYGENEPYFPDNPVCGLSRLDLSVTTVNALTPAYATDVVALGETGKTVRSCLTFQGKQVFSVDDGGIYYTGSKLMEAGWIKQGTISYSVEDIKTGLYVQSKWLPLLGKVAVDIAYDNTGYVRLAEYQIPGSIRSGNTSLDGTQFSRVDVRYVLKRREADPMEGPKFTRWEIRAIPAKGRASRWTLPIMNYEEVEIDSIKYTRDPLAVLDTLMTLVESGQLFTLQEAGRAYSVHAKDFLWQPEKLTNNGRAWQGTFVLVVEEVQ